MTPAAVWKIARASLDEVLLARGFKRLKPSPPAWTKKDGKRACTVWLKSRASGSTAGEGGAFTGALQYAKKPEPGIEWMDGDFESRRLYELFSPAEKKQAHALFAAVVAKRTRNTTEKITAGDIWCVFLDEDDVKAWCALLGGALARKLDR